jgi:threonine aldolase
MIEFVKYSFFDTKPESAHNEILKFLIEHNHNHFIDPQKDKYRNLGEDRIKRSFDIPSADIHFLPTGTVSNVLATSIMLRPYEAVISPSTGHINTYEAGAIEATGHKIVQVDTPDGKLTPAHIKEAMENCEDGYAVVPKAVYLTNVTEEGTVYTKEELKEVIEFAKSKGLYVYLDGSRLAMALAEEEANITPAEFGQLDLDAFYIGGTKNGGMYGEALVIKNDQLKPHFLSYMKRQGGHLSKQRLMSLQFARFFADDNLWLNLAVHANHMAQVLRSGLRENNTDCEGQANHVFMSLKNNHIEQLEEDFEFARWEKIDENTTRIRLVCSWATRAEDIDNFLKTIRGVVKS